MMTLLPRKLFRQPQFPLRMHLEGGAFVVSFHIRTCIALSITIAGFWATGKILLHLARFTAQKITQTHCDGSAFWHPLCTFLANRAALLKKILEIFLQKPIEPLCGLVFLLFACAIIRKEYRALRPTTSSPSLD